MEILTKKDGSYCDFCLKNNDTFARASTKVDGKRESRADNYICPDCIKEAYSKFTQKSLIARTVTMFSNIAKRLLDNKTKTLIRAGFLSNDLELTDLGEEVLLSVMLNSNLETMVKEANEKIAEQEEAKK